ncbi:hypothetical protein ElyMa_002071100 [Elysia marginata]|uniref:Uncharacterized protein n=1 Tax=Elysia marginata TaxID=1093978 RepID=A0AAV4FB86_9GAST|nr:hypothetical protein ElyMa_002071100 [Elysia marginata]
MLHSYGAVGEARTRSSPSTVSRLHEIAQAVGYSCQIVLTSRTASCPYTLLPTSSHRLQHPALILYFPLAVSHSCQIVLTSRTASCPYTLLPTSSESLLSDCTHIAYSILPLYFTSYLEN